MSEVEIGILSPDDLKSKTQGKAFLSFLTDLLPEFFPQRYGNYEPLKQKINSDTLDSDKINEILLTWADPFLWKSRIPRKISADGRVWARGKNTHSAIYISGKFNSAKHEISSNRLVDFFKLTSAYFHADIAYLHLFSNQELESKNYEHMYMPFRQGLSTHELRKSLPGLCWGTLLGSPYKEIFGKEKLLSTPGSTVEQLSEDIFYIQLTENIYDVSSNYRKFEQLRNLAKQHLNNNVFFDPKNSFSHKYMTPNFYYFEDGIKKEMGTIAIFPTDIFDRNQDNI